MSSEWQFYSLAKIALNGKEGFVDGPFGSALPASLYEQAGVPVVRGSNLSKGKERFRDDEFVFVSRETASRLARANCVAGDLIFTKKGTLGQIGIIPYGKYPVYLLSSNQMRLRVDRTVADPEFVYYYLAQEKSISKIIRDSEHTGVPKINLAYIREFPICLPSMKSQTDIVLLLRSLDDRITLLRETNATLEAIAQALFKSWFVDFDPVRAKAEGLEPEGMDAATGTLFPDSFEESELGLVPRGWKVGSLSEVCTISSGKRPPNRSDILTEDCKVPLFGGAGLMGYTSVSLFDAPRIVTGRVGTLGKVHIAYPPFWASDNVLVLLPKIAADFSFVLHWLRSIDVMALNRGSTQPLLTQRDLGAQQGVTPPREVPHKFEEVVGVLYDKIRSQETKAQTLIQLRDTLLPRLISGQLCLPEMEASVENMLSEAV